MGEGDQVREHQAGVIPPWTFHNVPFREGKKDFEGGLRATLNSRRASNEQHRSKTPFARIRLFQTSIPQLHFGDFFNAIGQTRTSSLGAARPLPPSADIGPGGQSVGQAAQFCLAAPTPAAGAVPARRGRRAAARRERHRAIARSRSCAAQAGQAQCHYRLPQLRRAADVAAFVKRHVYLKPVAAHHHRAL